VRFRVNGTSLKAKVWKETELEPETWHLETTDSDITDAGWVGAGAFAHNNDRDYDYFAVGTDGDTAPLPLTNTPILLSQLVVEAAADSNAPAHLSQLVVEAAFGQHPPAFLSQLVVEVAFLSGSAPPPGSGTRGYIFIAT
jgi:hypothetical protein